MIPIKDENPTSTVPIFTIMFIILNVAIYLLMLMKGLAVADGYQMTVFRYGVIPYEITHFVDIYPRSGVPLPITLMTSMFIHGGLIHLASNMLFLWIFGNNIEDCMGHIKFVIFYFICGITATLTHIISQPGSMVPMVGASGAIAGILGAYILLYPMARIKTLLFVFFFVYVVYVPAIIFIGLWFLLQVLNVKSGGNIAWYAHIGGFIAGLILIKPFEKKSHRFYRKIKRHFLY